MRGEGDWRIWGLICGELGLHATVPRCYSIRGTVHVEGVERESC
jgi:hypothetical protein